MARRVAERLCPCEGSVGQARSRFGESDLCGCGGIAIPPQSFSAKRFRKRMFTICSGTAAGTTNPNLRRPIVQESTITSLMRKPRLNLTRQQTILLGAAAIVVVGIAWYLFRPELLFVNQTVNEGLPASMTPTSMPDASPGMSDSSPDAVASGMFHKVAHDTKGTAAVYELGGGQHIVRLTGFETSNGPDVHVYLVAAADASDNSTVTQAGFLDLGSLKGNIGDQNYDIPAGADVAKYHAVTIWCKRFSVNFATAPLAMK